MSKQGKQRVGRRADVVWFEGVYWVKRYNTTGIARFYGDFKRDQQHKIIIISQPGEPHALTQFDDGWRVDNMIYGMEGTLSVGLNSIYGLFRILLQS